VSGKVVIKGDFGTPPPPAAELNAPVGKAMADNLKMAESQVTTTCSWVASSRRLETSRSLTAAQDLQADYVISIPEGYVSTAGETLSASGVSSAVTALGSNPQFTSDLKTNAAAAGHTITVTGVTATATVTEPTVPGGSGGAGPAPAPAASAEESSSNTGAIIGGILGAIFGISLIGVCVFCIIKKRKNEQE
jgi:cobalamin biosynthesis Mg chelatase CobN